ncbi:MAG: DUF370 domain-containing protein [Clostridia bacterium]|nr:DUF370 domain-containing protein [Clostridia bacterium]
MKLINIGYGNSIADSRIIAVIAPDSSPVKRIIADAKEKGFLVDATYGRKTKSVIVTDSSHVILSAVSPETISGRVNDNIGE